MAVPETRRGDAVPRRAQVKLFIEIRHRAVAILGGKDVPQGQSREPGWFCGFHDGFRVLTTSRSPLIMRVNITAE